eukprot:gnl/TRDRNA2_/TRDRNA2_129044_c0_seq1.p1 gnl/TRDRNA2_/TRDRNA2_129044_c0~~gnl/TRDRNA2_/TRDRNA2_129044_c0_seq1.p1  ORF type:complete len:174 (-),score=15.04 gnl/TRDRNA2_/TRDRNA2_129044_c0_seq1:39-497(-)
MWMFGEGPCISGAFDDPRAVFEPQAVPRSMFGGRRVLSAACGEGHLLALTAWDPRRCLPQPGTWFARSSTSRLEMEADDSESSQTSPTNRGACSSGSPLWSAEDRFQVGPASSASTPYFSSAPEPKKATGESSPTSAASRPSSSSEASPVMA